MNTLSRTSRCATIPNRESFTLAPVPGKRVRRARNMDFGVEEPVVKKTRTSTERTRNTIPTEEAKQKVIQKKKAPVTVDINPIVEVKQEIVFAPCHSSAPCDDSDSDSDDVIDIESTEPKNKKEFSMVPRISTPTTPEQYSNVKKFLDERVTMEGVRIYLVRELMNDDGTFRIDIVETVMKCIDKAVTALLKKNFSLYLIYKAAVDAGTKEVANLMKPTDQQASSATTTTVESTATWMPPTSAYPPPVNQTPPMQIKTEITNRIRLPHTIVRKRHGGSRSKEQTTSVPTDKTKSVEQVSGTPPGAKTKSVTGSESKSPDTAAALGKKKNSKGSRSRSILIEPTSNNGAGAKKKNSKGSRSRSVLIEPTSNYGAGAKKKGYTALPTNSQEHSKEDTKEKKNKKGYGKSGYGKSPYKSGYKSLYKSGYGGSRSKEYPSREGQSGSWEDLERLMAETNEDYEKETTCELTLNNVLLMLLLGICFGFLFSARTMYEEHTRKPNSVPSFEFTRHGGVTVISDEQACSTLAGRISTCSTCSLKQIFLCMHVVTGNRTDIFKMSGVIVFYGYKPKKEHIQAGKTFVGTMFNGSALELAKSYPPGDHNFTEALNENGEKLQKTYKQTTKHLRMDENGKLVDIGTTMVRVLEAEQNRPRANVTHAEKKAIGDIREARFQRLVASHRTTIHTVNWGKLDFISTANGSLGPIAVAIIQATLQKFDSKKIDAIPVENIDEAIQNFTIRALCLYGRTWMFQKGRNMTEMEMMDKMMSENTGCSKEKSNIKMGAVQRTISVVLLNTWAGFLRAVISSIGAEGGCSFTDDSTSGTRSLPFVNAAPVIVEKDDQPFLVVTASGGASVLDDVVSATVHAIIRNIHPVKAQDREKRNFYHPVNRVLVPRKPGGHHEGLQAVRISSIDGIIIMEGAIETKKGKRNVPVGH